MHSRIALITLISHDLSILTLYRSTILGFKSSNSPLSP